MEQLATLDRAVDFHQKVISNARPRATTRCSRPCPGTIGQDNARESDDTVWLSADGVKELAQCIKQNPDDYVAYNNIALGLFQLEKHDAALRQLDRALELKPDHPEALALAAKIKKSSGTGRCRYRLEGVQC